MSKLKYCLPEAGSQRTKPLPTGTSFVPEEEGLIQNMLTLFQVTENVLSVVKPFREREGTEKSGPMDTLGVIKCLIHKPAVLQAQPWVGGGNHPRVQK